MEPHKWKTGWWIGRWYSEGPIEVTYSEGNHGCDGLARVQQIGGLIYTKHIFPTREQALAEIDKARLRKIAGLRKQIAKLEAMTFE